MPDHLHEIAKEYLVRSIDDRMHYVMSDRWIGYSAASEVLQRLEDALVFPKSRRNNLLIVGDSGNGKSTLLERFERKHPVNLGRETGEDPCLPVCLFEMPPTPTEGRFWSAMLSAQHIPFKDRDTPDQKQRMALKVIAANRTRMVMIDEFHNVSQGSAKTIRQMLAVIRNMSNTLSIPIVAAGTREAIVTLNQDAQLTTRFEIITLPRWALNQEFLQLLASFESLLPFPEPSGFTSQMLATKIFSLSNGTIGGCSDLIRRAASSALRAGAKSVSLAEIETASRFTSHQFEREARSA
jgi:hypothetical protein